MDGLIASLPPLAGWELPAFGGLVGVGALLHAWPYLRRAWHQRRLRRRIAANSQIFTDEYREYQWSIGDDLPPFDGLAMLRDVVPRAALAAASLWIAGSWLDRWMLIALGIFMAFSAIRWTWRRVNDPPELHEQPEIAVPREAVIGFVGAIAVVAAILLAVAAIY